MSPEDQQVAISEACGKGHRQVTGMEALTLATVTALSS